MLIKVHFTCDPNFEQGENLFKYIFQTHRLKEL